MDFSRFHGIGIIDVYWDYDEFSSSWKKAFISLYFPKEKGYKQGEQYCIKYYFLENDIVTNEETFESNNFDLEVLEEKEDYVLITMLGVKHKTSNKQLELIKIIENNNY